MKIFITGGTGFIGQAVVRRLQRAGHQLLVLTQKKGDAKRLFSSAQNIKLIHGSLADLKPLELALRRFRASAVIHLAWEGIPDYGTEMSAKNLIYGVSLVEMMSRLNCPLFIGVGSCWEYGTTVGRIGERAIPRATNPFTAAKLSLRLFGEQVAGATGMKFIWARLFYVYGPGQKPISLIPAVINSAKLNKLPTLKNPHGGNDFIYVDDVADAILRIIKNSSTIPAGDYNVGSGRLTGVSQVVQLVSQHFPGIPKLPSTKQGPVGFYANINKLHRATGWLPRTEIKAGIKQTVDYFQRL